MPRPAAPRRAPRTGKPARRRAPDLGRRRRRSPPDARGLRCGLLRRECLQLRLEEVLVDLPLIDRHALFDAHPDHLLPVETELFRQFFGREVIRHWLAPSPGTKKPAARNALAG